MISDSETGIIITRDAAGYEYFCEVAVVDLDEQDLLDAQINAAIEREVRAEYAVEDGWIHARVYPDVEEPTTDPFRIVFDEERGQLVSVDIETDESQGKNQPRGHRLIQGWYKGKHMITCLNCNKMHVSRRNFEEYDCRAELTRREEVSA